MPLERVPRAQKEITRAARRTGIPVIVATQVLESMMTEARPTRAEVSDAANAVDDGVDAIMLAGETAAGAFPARAVQTLDAIIRDVESTPTTESARRLSALRPRAPIIATTDRDETARRLTLYWGVVPVCTDIGENVDTAGALVSQEIVARGLVGHGDAVVLVSISADLTRSDANYL